MLLHVLLCLSNLARTPLLFAWWIRQVIISLLLQQTPRTKIHTRLADLYTPCEIDRLLFEVSNRSSHVVIQRDVGEGVRSLRDGGYFPNATNRKILFWNHRDEFVLIGKLWRDPDWEFSLDALIGPFRFVGRKGHRNGLFLNQERISRPHYN